MTPEDITRAITDAEKHLAEAETLATAADAEIHGRDVDIRDYAGSCAHSLLAIAGLLRVGLEPEA